jgi:hypothetical protein
MNAVLHRTYKGSFKGESYESLSGYLGKPQAFHASESGLQLEAIAERMDEAYYKLETPLFAALTEGQIRLWTMWLLPSMTACMNSADGKLSNDRARGMLYRMFVGEFDDMSEAELTEWRTADPSINGEYETNNETALLYMNTLYRVADAVQVPWLKDSLLHWRPRRHRPSRAEPSKRKRKRDVDDDDKEEDDDEKGKRDAKRPKPQTSKGGVSKPPGPPESIQASLIIQAPQSIDDQKKTYWAVISEANLKKHITDAIRQDHRIDRKANSYTYRAILFLLHGGTFKNDSQTVNTNLWVRDT